MKVDFDLEEIEEVIEDSLSRLINRDNELIERRLKEECINHCLAKYLETELRDWEYPYHIDLEYNKNGENTKGYVKPNGDVVNAIPDIIVHRRGNNEDNLLFVEIKKYDSSDLDLVKAEAFLRQGYDYDYSCLINYRPGSSYMDVKILNRNNDNNGNRTITYRFSKENSTLIRIE